MSSRLSTHSWFFIVPSLSQRLTASTPPVHTRLPAFLASPDRSSSQPLGLDFDPFVLRLSVRNLETRNGRAKRCTACQTAFRAFSRHVRADGSLSFFSVDFYEFPVANNFYLHNNPRIQGHRQELPGGCPMRAVLNLNIPSAISVAAASPPPQRLIPLALCQVGSGPAVGRSFCWRRWMDQSQVDVYLSVVSIILWALLSDLFVLWIGCAQQDPSPTRHRRGRGAALQPPPTKQGGL